MFRPIIGWCLSNRPVVLLLALIVLGLGAYSTTQLNQQLLPNTAFPEAVILVSQPGAGPEQVDRDIAKPLSDQLIGVQGLQHIRSTSSPGYAEIDLIFDYGTNMRAAIATVQQKINQVQLPDTATRPLVETLSLATTSATMLYSLSAQDGDLARISREARELIVPAVSGVTGVATVGVAGTQQRQVSITLDAAKMSRRGVNASSVQQALKAAQVDTPVGTSTRAGKTLPVQVLGTARSADDLKKIIVGEQGTTAPPETIDVSRLHDDLKALAEYVGFELPSSGMPAPLPPRVVLVSLGDVATVQETTVSTNGVSRTNGQAALTLEVVATPDGNAINISRDVKDQLSKIHLDSRDSLQLVSDNATAVKASLNDLVVEGIAGALLAIVVIFLFLHSLRGTLVTAVALPASVLVALVATRVAGYSLNVLTLAGLTIAIGRIVDDAIVVLENSYRHLQAGEDPRQAALNGATEVSLPIASSTLTTVAVFLPIGLVGGLVSLLFVSFALTLVVALLASLLVAITVIPVLASLLLARRAGQAQRESLLARVYRPALGWAIRGPFQKAAVLAITVVLLTSSVIAATRLPVNLFDLGASELLIGSVNLPAGTSVQQTAEQLRAFEDRAKADPDVKMVLVTIGNSTEGAIAFAPQSNQASITVLARDNSKSADLVNRLQDVMDSLYGKGNGSIAARSAQDTGGGTTFQVTIRGTDPAKLRQASDMIAAAIGQDPDLSRIRSSLAAEQPQLQVNVDPVRAAARGFSPQLVAAALTPALSPQNVGRLAGAGTPVVLQVDPASTTADRLADLLLMPGVRLKDVATVSDTFVAENIQRDNGKQEVTVTAQIVNNDTQGASNQATSRIESLKLPPGVDIVTGGASEAIITSFTGMYVAIGVAIMLVYLILVLFFRSLVTPLIILLTMPLSLIGGLFALYVFKSALGVSALLGLLMLLGVVVSNGILLIDFTEKERARGRPLREALLRAGSVRLRPILMTALATIVALLPVSLGISTGGGGGLISQSLAIVVEGGLVTSTILTLVVLPVMYSLVRRRPALDEVASEAAAD
ncbi:MAG TPA: efflux RND transporter permease subunit [Candidatus Dormibacteraeota bacterium]|nr:efflux RND transporter permease subunit [Candidatus Dormibacteraeota bacterium]